MPADRRTLLLGGVLLALVGVAGWFWFAPSAAAPVSASSPEGRARSGDGGGALPEAEAVRLPALRMAREAPGDAARNPFRFGRRGAAPGGGASPVAAPPPLTLTPVDAPPTAPGGPAPPPPISLKFIGVVQMADGTKLAVLTAGEGRAPLYGKEGDIIDGRYRILGIGLESVDVAYVDGRGRQTIKLTGQ